LTDSNFEFLPIAGKDDIPSGSRLVIEVDGNLIVIFNVNNQFFAIDGICSHDEEELAEGTLEGYVLTCPRHGGQFDIRDGNAISLPAFQEINIHPVEVRGDEVLIGLPINS
jgi:3-phenylpropionate/trans-cinnamate dioxygenase ferredoxin component